MTEFIIQEKILQTFAHHIPKHLRSHEMVVITDNTVKKLYAQQVVNSLQQTGYTPTLVTFPAGEKYKTRETKAKIESTLLKKGLGRKTCIIAVGGGVVGDLAGFVAATYMRGIPYIQVPTTLLAMIDSSVGGKTGVNTPEGKNMVGAFWNPEAVIADVNCLETLSLEHQRNGWVEGFKIFAVADCQSFHRLLEHKNFPLDLIKRAIALKQDIVSHDPDEKHIRAALNFGHTIGHALEASTKFKMLHGFAVAYGILIESHLSLQRDLISQHEFNTIVEALKSRGFQGTVLKKHDLNLVLAYAKQDKKNQSQRIHCVMLDGIGHVYSHQDKLTHAVTEQAIREAWVCVSEELGHVR
jgi:3-dehydroquinate synthase